MPDEPSVLALAQQHWNADRAQLRTEAPEWKMPAWSRAPAWRRRPYILAAQHGRHPNDDNQEEPTYGAGGWVECEACGEEVLHEASVLDTIGP